MKSAAASEPRRARAYSIRPIALVKYKGRTWYRWSRQTSSGA